MKVHYDTLWELFDDLATEYNVEIPMITGGLSRECTMRFSFDVNHKSKRLQVQVYRLPSGRYEYNGYIL